MVVGQSSAWADVTDDGGSFLVRIGGELDATSRDSIEPAVMAAISGAPGVTIDFRDLTFCDSTGIAILINASRAAVASGCVLTACNIPASVRRVFDIVALGDLIDLRD
jgi:anti-sigma B factor antagonist